MAHEYTVDAERRLVRVRMWGALRPADIQMAAAELAADSRLSRDYAELIDLRDVTSIAAVGSQDVRAIAAGALDPPTRRAFVTPDSATFGLARMFAALRSLRDAPEDVGVFRTIAEAEAWLGL